MEFKKVFEFIEDSVETDDVGQEFIDSYTVLFEGFTAECWEFAGDASIEEIEHDILEDWGERLGSDTQLLYADWRGDVFFAIYL